MHFLILPLSGTQSLAMYLRFLVNATLAICCSAWPTQYGSPQAGFLDSYQGSKSKRSTDLTLPIVIPGHADWRVFYNEGFTDKPSGFELAATIVANIYVYWRDDANLPIRSKTACRRLPYTKFLNTVQPSFVPGTSLTPQILARGYLNCLQHVATLQDWPGHFTAQLLARERPGTSLQDIGFIGIDNSPDPGNIPVPETAADNATTSDNGLSVTPTQTKRWLTCFGRVYFFIVSHAWSDKVTDDPNMSPKRFPARYRHPCPDSSSDTWEMIVYPQANNVLTWEGLNRGMLKWLADVSTAPGIYLDKFDVTKGGTVFLELRIRFDMAGAEEQNGAVATA
ncbi:MAG: hypothetical protein Q9170_006597 [Blastenia crenularia]